MRNPAAPARVEITYSGAGSYTGFVLDDHGRELDRFTASLGEVRRWASDHYPGVPVRFIPLRNPHRRRPSVGEGQAF